MKKSNINIAFAAGRRKTAVARVYLRQGNGHIVVNGKTLDEYFVLDLQKAVVRSPLKVCDVNYDVLIRVDGGGKEGQAVAARHAISRALVKEDEERRAALKEQGFLTRDPRKRERKKYGQPGALKSFQFSKR